jgi:hypothetical protein
MFAKNLAQTPAGAIADDGSPDVPGSNEAGANGRFCFGIFQNAECKRSTADGGAFRPNALEFAIQSESARLRMTKASLHCRDFSPCDGGCQLEAKGTAGRG